MNAFTPVAVIVIAFLLIFGVVGGWFLAGRMVRPLNRMADAAHRVSLGALSDRIHLDGPRDEFRELSDVFDSMLDTLEHLVAEQRRFAANASHELRTPLAVTQTLLDNAAADPDRDVETLITRLQEVNTRAVALTEALLLLSRSARRTFDRESLDLSLVTEHAAETLSPLASRYGIHLDLHSETAELDGSTALLGQLASNLIHNAIVHNCADRGQVWVRVQRDARTAVLTVKNTGPVVARETLVTLTEPFQRGTTRPRAGTQHLHAGFGLGLTIADRIAQAHEGELLLTSRDGGGLIAAISLPVRGATESV